MIVKAVFPERADSKELASRWLAVTPYLLLDKFDRLKPGGTGMAFEWSLISDFADMEARIIIAGGITPENVSGILSFGNIFGIDVSSGVEIAPGIKSKAKMKRLLKKVKNKDGQAAH
jgi:phosphoribosylanthranilate isomerase